MPIVFMISACSFCLELRIEFYRLVRSHESICHLYPTFTHNVFCNLSIVTALPSICYL